MLAKKGISGGVIEKGRFEQREKGVALWTTIALALDRTLKGNERKASSGRQVRWTLRKGTS